MNSTDRAFIAAYQQSNLGVGVPEADEAGPHFVASEGSGRKAPLAAYLAERRGQTPGVWTPHPLEPGVELGTFAWPAIVQRMASECAESLNGLIGRFAADTPSEPVAFYSTDHGMGASTLVLGLARAGSGAGLSVALIDAQGGADGLAAALGVRRAASPGIEPGASIDAALIASRADHVSLLVASHPSLALASAATARLRQTHDLVLIDAGPAGASDGWPGDGLAVLVDRAGGDPSRRERARNALSSGLGPEDGGSLCGLIETFAPAE